MISRSWTSWEQSHGYRTKMRGEWLRCCGRWCQRQQRDQEGKVMIYFCDPIAWMRCIVNVQKNSFGEMMFTVCRLVRSLLEVRWSIRQDLTTRSIFWIKIMPVVCIHVCCSCVHYVELPRSKLHKTGDHRVGNWHVNCQHSSLQSLLRALPQWRPRLYIA